MFNLNENNRIASLWRGSHRMIIDVGRNALKQAGTPAVLVGWRKGALVGRLTLPIGWVLITFDIEFY